MSDQLKRAKEKSQEYGAKAKTQPHDKAPPEKSAVEGPDKPAGQADGVAQLQSDAQAAQPQSERGLDEWDSFANQRIEEAIAREPLTTCPAKASASAWMKTPLNRVASAWRTHCSKTMT